MYFERGKIVVIYNALFDARLLSQTAKLHETAALPVIGFDCAMQNYAAFVGEWSHRYGNHKFQTYHLNNSGCG
ncbi:MAG: hypothetical protein AABZ78_19255 [Chloroflexota bacterium]